MPISVQVNHAKNTITLVCWGDITIEDMMDYERRYWGGPEHEGYHHIVDLQVANVKIDLNEGLMLATHAMCSPKIREVDVFYDMQEAKAWVDASVVTWA